MGIRVGLSWVGPADRVVVFHCPAGGAEMTETSTPSDNLWAGPSPMGRADADSSQTWWRAMRKISPGMAEAEEDLVEFSKDYYKCKRLRKTHEYVDQEWQTLLSFGAGMQTQGRWPRPGDQPSILVGASQSGNVLLSFAGLIGAMASGVKTMWRALRT